MILLSVGLNPWIDKENLLPGQEWKRTITKAISESSYFIALLSTNSISKKGYIQKELRLLLMFGANYLRPQYLLSQSE